LLATVIMFFYILRAKRELQNQMRKVSA